MEKLLSHNSQSGGKLLDQRAGDLISGLDREPITPGARLGALTESTGCSGRGGMGQRVPGYGYAV